MKRYLVENLQRQGTDVIILTLRPRKENDQLQFYPGQYAAIGFRQNGRPTPMRCFSIISTPAERTILRFALKIQGDFTEAAATLEPGDTVYVSKAFGNFIVDETLDKEIVMVAGGIGITPFISMLGDAADRHLGLPITLLYSSRDSDTLPFQTELTDLQQRNPRLAVALFSTAPTPRLAADRRFVQGRIGAAHLRQVIARRKATQTFFICGSTAFMDGIVNTLHELGVSDSHIITEAFSQGQSLKAESFGGRYSFQTLAYAGTAALLLLGTGFIMSLDIARTVPKLASAAAATGSSNANSSSSPSTSSSNSNTSSSTDTTTTAPSSSATTPSTSSTSSNTPAQTYYYQPPVTSVS